MKDASSRLAGLAVTTALAWAACASEPAYPQSSEDPASPPQERRAEERRERPGGNLGDPAALAQEVEELGARREEISTMADETIERLRRENRAAAEQLDAAYGHAVFDTTKGGLIVTGAGGTGVARESATGKETFMHVGAAGIGVGVGVENYKLVLLFEDGASYEQFVGGRWDGSISAQAAAGDEGAATEEQFVDGVSVYRLTDSGWIAQVDVSGMRFWPSKELNGLGGGA